MSYTCYIPFTAYCDCLAIFSLNVTFQHLRDAVGLCQSNMSLNISYSILDMRMYRSPSVRTHVVRGAK